jgi:peptidoglycan/LPS O-acetylase OafA/YrhL
MTHWHRGWRWPRGPRRVLALGGGLGVLLATSLLVRPELAPFSLGSTVVLLVAGLLWADDHPSGGRGVRARVGRALRQGVGRVGRRGGAHGARGHRPLAPQRTG